MLYSAGTGMVLDTNTFCLPQNIGCFHTCLGLILKKSIASLCRISGFITPL